MKSTHCVVFVTAPRGTISKKIINAILDSRAAACVNVLPSIQSYYRWKGRRESGRECLLVIKTRSQLFKKLEAVVRRVHPYSVPEILQLPIKAGHAPYLDWIDDETAP